jgi:hypothetical protein
MDYNKNNNTVKGSLAIKKDDDSKFIWGENIYSTNNKIEIPTVKSIFPNGISKLTGDNSCDICCASSLMGT